jgi:hypothetical protein
MAIAATHLGLARFQHDVLVGQNVHLLVHGHCGKRAFLAVAVMAHGQRILQAVRNRRFDAGLIALAGFLQAIAAHAVGDDDGVVDLQNLIQFLDGHCAIAALGRDPGLVHQWPAFVAEDIPLLRERIGGAQGREIDRFVAARRFRR